jgi:hypothetical protein
MPTFLATNPTLLDEEVNLASGLLKTLGMASDAVVERDLISERIFFSP